MKIKEIGPRGPPRIRQWMIYLRRQHPEQQSVGFLLLLDELLGSLLHYLLQIERVLLHHVQDVVHDVNPVREKRQSPGALLVITVRKQSLGQGNIFRSVCQEFCSQGVLSQCMRADIPPGRHSLTGRHPLGRHPCGQTPLWADTPPADTSPWADHSPPPKWPLQRTVRILLECILVTGCFAFTLGFAQCAGAPHRYSLSAGHPAERAERLPGQGSLLLLLAPARPDQRQHRVPQLRALRQHRAERRAFSVTNSINYVCLTT